MTRPPLRQRSPWRERAACLDYPTERFFPPGDDKRAEAAAKAVCRTCPVIRPCLRYALDTPERYGVWGGLGEGDRRRLARALRQEAKGKPARSLAS